MMDAVTARSAGNGDALASMSAVAWNKQDYAWTHSSPVEGFFVVLTIVIVPAAIYRWLRRMRFLQSLENRQPHRDLGI
jgi:hypothetical protein